MDLLVEHAALELLAKHVGRQNIRNPLQKISGVGLTFNANPDFAQSLHPPPNRRARNANLFSNSLAADGNGGVVGKKREQGSEPPVSAARKGSVGHGSCA